MQPYPRALDLVWPGHLHGMGCLSARAMAAGFPTVVSRLCLGPGCASAQVPVTPPTRAGFLGACVWVRVSGFAPPFPAGICGVCGWAWVLDCTPPSLAQVLGRAWLCARSACTPPLPARVCGVGVCACARVSAAPRHSWLRFRGVCVCVRVPPGPLPLLPGGAVQGGVLGVGLQPRPASPGWGVGACVCFCARPACTPLLLAGVCGVDVCAWARVSAVPRHSWLGRWGVSVFVRVVGFYPAISGGVVCVGGGLV